MAKDPSRTERATPKRREKARKEGSIPRSQDFDATMLAWLNFFLFLVLGSSIMTLLGKSMVDFLRMAQPGMLTEQNLRYLVVQLGWVMARLLFPFLAINFLVALGLQISQHGLHAHAELLMPKFNKLNPVSGLKRLFSVQTGMDLLKSSVKLVVLAWVAYLVIGPRLPTLLSTLRMPVAQSLELFKDTLFFLYRDVLIAMLVLGLVDFFWQRKQYEDNIMMTKQEVKDEAKDAEGNPEIKGQQRALMRAAARRRMLAAVPKATVVITNPTHVAVALRYDESSPAPICVAKGLDFLAQKIKEVAREHEVPILEDPPLARALYKAVELEGTIPPSLYQAVAQVLAFVYRLKAARS